MAKEPLLLLFIHTHQTVSVIGEVQHNILELEISVNNQDLHHVVEPFHQLLHDLLDGPRVDDPSFLVHQLLDIAAITEFHKNVVA